MLAKHGRTTQEVAMAKQKSEHARIEDLEGIVPRLWDEVENLQGTLADVDFGARAPTGLSAMPLGTVAPLMMSGCIFPAGLFPALAAGFEETAATAGELISQAEDMADDLDLDKDDLPADGEIPDGNSEKEKVKRKDQAKQANDLAGKVKELIDLARKAKGKVAGAAGAAKKFGGAVAKIKEAEASFKKSKKKLRDIEKKNKEIRNSPPDHPTKPEVKALRDLAKQALDLAAADLEHLKAALAAIK